MQWASLKDVFAWLRGFEVITADACAGAIRFIEHSELTEHAIVFSVLPQPERNAVAITILNREREQVVAVFIRPTGEIEINDYSRTGDQPLLRIIGPIAILNFYCMEGTNLGVQWPPPLCDWNVGKLSSLGHYKIIASPETPRRKSSASSQTHARRPAKT